MLIFAMSRDFFCPGSSLRLSLVACSSFTSSNCCAKWMKRELKRQHWKIFPLSAEYLKTRLSLHIGSMWFGRICRAVEGMNYVVLLKSSLQSWIFTPRRKESFGVSHLCMKTPTPDCFGNLASPGLLMPDLLPGRDKSPWMCEQPRVWL